MCQLYMNIKKAIPSLALFLSKDIWQLNINAEHKIDIGYWQYNDDGSISKIPDNIFNLMPLKSKGQVMSAEAFFTLLIEYLYIGKLLQIWPKSKPSDYLLLKKEE